MDKAASDELRSKLNNLIEKEIKYREGLLQKFTHQGYIKIFPNNIKNLKKLKQYGNGSYDNFILYYTEILRLQPNINGSPVNKIISNLDSKYSNKSKYSN